MIGKTVGYKGYGGMSQPDSTGLVDCPKELLEM